MTTAITHDRLQAALRDDPPPLVIDVRRKAAYLEATELIEGALRRDPEALASWADQLPRSARVVVYCAHGREVSQRAAAELARRGFDACFLEGGILHEAGPQERIFKDPDSERTRELPGRTIEAGRH